MNVLDPDNLHRTAKLELDEGTASTLEEVNEITSKFVLQIDAGNDILESTARQATLLTAVNASCRAFVGGVRVHLHRNGPMHINCAGGQDLASSIKNFGGEIVDSLCQDFPTLVIGDVEERPPGTIVLYTTWQGWTAGVVERPEDRLPESIDFPLSGVLAAALGTSEAFQHVRGHIAAGRRAVGISLWQPQQDWRDDSSFGPPCRYLPSKLWLIGLGHLGQAFAWAIALLPYSNPSDVKIMLQDYDKVVMANKSTGMLSFEQSIGKKKSRVTAKYLESLGFRTAITERPFDSKTYRGASEPGVALVGMDDPTPRRLLEGAGFDLVVDAGLGGTAQNYLSMAIHTFPSGIAAETTWPESAILPDETIVAQPGYLDYQRRLAETTNLTEGEIKCGVIEIAGRAAGAAFVGCTAATLVIAEVLRTLNDGPRFQLLRLQLRNPHLIQAIPNPIPELETNPGFVSV